MGGAIAALLILVFLLTFLVALVGYLVFGEPGK